MLSTIIEFVDKKPDTAIALAALLVSVVGTIIAIITFYSSHRHNRLSVRPIAYILPQDFEDKICVVIQNKGTGPLICKSLEFVNFKKNRVENSLIDHMPMLIGACSWRSFSKPKRLVLSPGESKILLELTGSVEDPDFQASRDRVRIALADVEIRMVYSGIYEEFRKQKFDYKLTWYNRHR